MLSFRKLVPETFFVSFEFIELGEGGLVVSEKIEELLVAEELQAGFGSLGLAFGDVAFGDCGGLLRGRVFSGGIRSGFRCLLWRLANSRWLGSVGHCVYECAKTAKAKAVEEVRRTFAGVWEGGMWARECGQGAL